MPMAITRGAASAYAVGFCGSANTATPISSGIGNTSGATNGTYSMVWTGAVAGDIAVVYIPYEGTDVDGNFTDNATVSGTGWTKSSLNWSLLGYWSAVFWKELAAGDVAGRIATTPNVTGVPVIFAVYRGPTVASVKSTNAGASGTTLTLGGFTKSASSKAILSFVSDRDASATPAPPAPFAAVQGPGTSTTFTANLAAITSAGLYSNGTDVVWTGFGNTFEQTGYLLELT